MSTCMHISSYSQLTQNDRQCKVNKTKERDRETDRRADKQLAMGNRDGSSNSTPPKMPTLSFLFFQPFLLALSLSLFSSLLVSCIHPVIFLVVHYLLSVVPCSRFSLSSLACSTDRQASRHRLDNIPPLFLFFDPSFAISFSFASYSGRQHHFTSCYRSLFFFLLTVNHCPPSHLLLFLILFSTVE